MNDNAAPVERIYTKNHSEREHRMYADLSRAFLESPLDVTSRLNAFPRHVRRQDIARFLVRYELFRQILDVNGSIVDCGVYSGGGLFAWYHFSTICEPYNHTRKIIGFDTFSGFPSIHASDAIGDSDDLRVGALSTHATMRDELEYLRELHDQNRPLSHVPKMELVEGDACETIPAFVDDNPHLLISLLYLDFDLYAPTRAALEHLLPRVVAGGLVVFDELNSKDYPGETSALLELGPLPPLKRMREDPYISYFVKS